MSDYSDMEVFDSDSSNYGKKINPIPRPERDIGIDTKDSLLNNIIDAGTSSQLNIAELNAFTSISQNRDTLYTILDSMAEDSTIAAALETYAEDATERNDQGKIVWCESDNPEVLKYVTFLLESMRIDKNIYKWVYSLCKYGDLYIKLFRESEVKDDLFDDLNRTQRLNESTVSEMNEAVQMKVFAKGDHFVNHVEMVPNPAEIFELTKFGKTHGYIEAPITSFSQNTQTQSDPLYYSTNAYLYKFRRTDINLYNATSYVHAALEDNMSRVPERVDIFLNDTDYNNDSNGYAYTVRRGQSILYSTFRIWRENMMLENSILLNRLTKSSIVRIVNVEVGDMPKESVGPHLQGIKSLIEQKAAINASVSLSEYTNPGPIENTVYVPTHGGVGSISMQDVGGNVEVSGLDDLSHFTSKLYGALKIPKQYMGFTEDGAGFDGGKSLSLLSSRYAKTIRRIQNTILQALTDIINIICIDRGLNSYINNFTLQMVPPTTQEELDRRDNTSQRLQLVRDIMDLLSDIEDQQIRFEILKSLLSGVVTDSNVMTLLQAEIDKLAEEKRAQQEAELEKGSDDLSSEEDEDFSDFEDEEDFENETDVDNEESSGNMNDIASFATQEENTTENPDVVPGEETGGELPSLEDIDIDFSDNTHEF